MNNVEPVANWVVGGGADAMRRPACRRRASNQGRRGAGHSIANSHRIHAASRFLHAPRRHPRNGGGKWICRGVAFHLFLFCHCCVATKILRYEIAPCTDAGGGEVVFRSFGLVQKDRKRGTLPDPSPGPPPPPPGPIPQCPPPIIIPAQPAPVI